MTDHKDDELELWHRLDAVFDGRGWALTGWVKENLGRDLAHELPGPVAPFNQLCHEAAAEIVRRGMTGAALGLLRSQKSVGWAVELRAASRYVLPLLVAVGVAVVLGYPVILFVGIMVGVVLVPEVRRWWKRKGEVGLRVSGLRPLLVAGAGVIVLAWPFSLRRSPELTVAGVPPAPAEARRAAPSPTPPEEKVQVVEPRRVPPGASWPKRDPSWDDVPECMADAMRDQKAAGLRFSELDRVVQEADPTQPPTSEIDLGPYSMQKGVQLTVCCSDCPLGLIPVPAIERLNTDWNPDEGDPKGLARKQEWSEGSAVRLTQVAMLGARSVYVYSESGSYFPGRTIYFAVTSDRPPLRPRPYPSD